jgi:hypothetical protein
MLKLQRGKSCKGNHTNPHYHRREEEHAVTSDSSTGATCQAIGSPSVLLDTRSGPAQWYQWEFFQFELSKFVAYSGDLSEFPSSIGQNCIT